MTLPLRCLLTLLLPIVWLLVIAFAGLVLAIDLLCMPWLWWLRRALVDRAPATRNASVVVLNWNGLHFLRELMPSLQTAIARCPGDHEVIVVDNGSDDGSAEWLAREHAWAKVVRLPENRFFIRGNAAGAAVATRDILVYLNNDMRVEPDWLVELLRPFGPDDLFATSSRIEMQGNRTETGLTRCVSYSRPASPALRCRCFGQAAAAARSIGASTTQSAVSRPCTSLATSRTSACRTRRGSAAGGRSMCTPASCTMHTAAPRAGCSAANGSNA